VSEPEPATPGQEQVWFFDQLVPDATFHNLPLLVDIEGPLEVDALAAGLTAIVRRHEPLRTTFAQRDTGPVSIVADPVEVPVTVHDLSDVDENRRALTARRLVDEQIAARLDIGPAGNGLAVRAMLLRLREQHHRLVLVLHHIASDGASALILQRELVAAYATALAGDEPLAGAPATTYRELARRTTESTDDLAWWTSRLADLPEPPVLPGERNRTGEPDFTAATVPLVVPERLAGEVRELAKQARCSVFTVLLTAFTALLARSTGTRDLVVGTPSAGRDDPESADLVGYFVNMLALRVRIDGDPTWQQLLDGVRDTVLSGLDHRHTPFHEIVRAVRPGREVDRHPVFQIVFAAPPPLAGPATAGACVFTFTEGTSKHALYDLEIQLPDDSSGRMRGFVKYRTARYAKSDIEDLAGRFVELLAKLTGSRAARMSNQSLLTPAQRGRIVRELNATATGYPANSSVTELFAAVRTAHGGSPAVHNGSTRLTYAELDVRANQLAHHLRGLGVRRGTPVGVCLDRGVDWVSTALGVLQAGCAYLPLDPDYPADRLAWLCADAGAEFVVMDTDERPRPALDGVRVMDLAESRDEIAAEPLGAPPSVAGPDDLAYVMYTSGSTGTPKGVCVTHRNIVRLVRDTNYVEFRAGDRVAQGSTTTFDAATFEIWGALLAGAELVGLPKDIALDAHRLGEWLRANRIDTLFLTTSLAMHVASESPEALNGLRYFVFGGEQPDVHAVARLAALDGAPEHIVNGYGPTETATFAASHRCNDVTTDLARVPLGRPLANSTLYVLDAWLEPVPPLVVGELCIGGDGVSRGYVGSAELTAERFVPDHLSGKPGARLYRTGDLARQLPDGTIEFLGRADRQVKIRGFRIEPGEVENCLRQSGLVKEAAVVATPDAVGDAHLVGYVVLTAPAEFAADELMAHLRASLPDYLVPGALVVLPAFPLTPNGKLDVRALPEPSTRPEADEDTAGESTPTEQRLAPLWQSVLGVERIGRHTNFFDLGGHSLKATRLVGRTAKELGREITLRTLFDNPTLAAFAAAVDSSAPATAEPAGPRVAARTGRSVADLLDALD
jgi:amino acid adenylation domain-containing protein